MYSIVVGLPQLHQAEAPWSPKLRWRSASSSALAACDLRMLIVLHDKTPINGGNKPFITYQRTAAEGPLYFPGCGCPPSSSRCCSSPGSHTPIVPRHLKTEARST